jgi:predicted ATPase/class 3 adenylate cyclase
MVRCPGCDTVNPDGVRACASCGTAIAVACARCGAGNPPLARFCCGCGSRLEVATDDEAPSSLSTPERRQITVLFCDVVGSTALSRQLDPEDWHRLIHRVHSKCDEVIARYHGHVAQLLGDGLLAYFGYPVATDDAPRQAVKAGLELTSEISKIEVDAGRRINVRVGIHTGPVIVGNVGSKRHQESLALGETPSLAARIQEVVPAGALVVSSETHHLIEGFFKCDELGTYELKGFPEPRELYRVLSETGPTTRLEAATAFGLTPLVGRQKEADRLAKAWELARGGNSSIHLIVGEAGIGKSRLIHTVMDRRRESGGALIQLRCSEYARSSAFNPVVEGLQRELGLRHGDPPDSIRQRLQEALTPTGLSPRQIKVLGALLGVALDVTESAPAQQLRVELFDALTAWICGPDSDPRLVVIEDLHWADPSMLELIKALVEKARTGSRVILMSSRPEFVPEWSSEAVETLTLGRLGSEETRELLSYAAGGKRLPNEVSDRIAARSEGIPLFLEEITRSVVESGVLQETQAGFVLTKPVSDSAIPASLHDSLMGRLDQLGHGKPVAQLAAVLGREFSYALFDAVWRDIPSAPRVNLGEGLERLVRAQLLTRKGERPDALYEFKHSLIQDAAYQSLLRSRCREYHQYTANALVKTFPARVEQEPELVAYHYSCAQKSDDAVRYWGKAGQRAVGATAYKEAISHFGAGLEQLAQLAPGEERSRQEIGLRSRLSVALITTAGFSSTEVEENSTRAAELCGELGDEIPIRVLYGTWAVNLVRGDLAATNRMVPVFERFAESSPDVSARLVAHAALGTWAFWRADYARSIVHNKAAWELRDAARPKEQHAALLDQYGFEGLLYPPSYLAWAQALTGETDTALRTWSEAETVADAIGDPYVKVGVYAFGAQMHRELRQFTRGAELSAKLLELCKEGGFTLWLAVGLVVGGTCRVALGHADEGISSIQEGMNLYRMIGARTPYAHYLRYLAEAYLERGDVELAIESAKEGISLSHTHLDRNLEGELLRLLGEAELRRGNSTAAAELFEQAIDLCHTQGARLLELNAATSLARLLIQDGKKPKAAVILRGVRSHFGTSTDLPSVRSADEILSGL